MCLWYGISLDNFKMIRRPPETECNGIFDWITKKLIKKGDEYDKKARMIRKTRPDLYPEEYDD